MSGWGQFDTNCENYFILYFRSGVQVSGTFASCGQIIFSINVDNNSLTDLISFNAFVDIKDVCVYALKPISLRVHSSLAYAYVIFLYCSLHCASHVWVYVNTV